MFRLVFVGILMILGFGATAGEAVISLAGEWRVRLDPDSTGVEKRFFDISGDRAILLPGTLDEAGYGTPTQGADYGILTRRVKYTGPAWYNRDFVIPRNWGNEEVTLLLERVMWQSRVWVDGREVGTQDGLGTPHHHTLGRLAPGRHTLTVRVNNDMIHNIGDKGHCYTEYTQTIWNGMVGRIELRPVEKLVLTGVCVWPNASQQSVDVTFNILNRNQAPKTTLSYTIREVATGRTVAKHTEQIALTDTKAHTAKIAMDETPKLWDEFSPNLYTIEIAIKNRVSENITFGFRDLSSDHSKILINGNRTFIRGNLDCVHFPLTGYPSCEVGDWEKIFKIYKAHGLNQVRFHSWCPPEAAFEAADRLGIYIQAEVLWIDWWMSTVNKDRPEMFTRGLPTGLGHNPSADAFVRAELRRMIDAYGNHPSFTMLCIGNELGNSDFQVMQSWIDEIKTHDPRRLYSVSTARNITTADQFMVTHNIPGVGATYGLTEGCGTDFDLEKNYSQATIPIIAHELGQFPVYPLWSEIAKYTGVVEARNLQTLRQLAIQNDLEHMDTAFNKSSGALQTILYKALIESLVRTPSCGGFAMLSMTDYSGQGEALVGWLDSFWESKNIVSPEVFRGYSNDVMLLARFPRYTWRSGERFSARIQMANYSPADFAEPITWTLTDTHGKAAGSGLLEHSTPQGKLSDVGEIFVELPAVNHAQRLILTTNCANRGYQNSWSIWVFPEADTTTQPQDVVIADRYDERVRQALQRGEKVVLMAAKLGREEDVTPLNFSPLFWSNSFFPGQTNKTLGLHINASHGALAGFPTDSHTDWQWQSLCRGRSFVLNAHPDLQPIVQPISDFHINDRLGSIFECRVGKGKLLVCGHDLTGDSPEAKALKNSLLSYVDSDNFNPRDEFTDNELQQLFYSPEIAPSALPEGFEEAILYVKCGELTPTGSTKWAKNLDKIQTRQKGCDYTVTCDDAWRDTSGTAWTGREIAVQITTPNGIIGDLYVKFTNPNTQQRRGIVTIEGRESVVENIPIDGMWVKLFVMREDTNDGKITLKIRTTEPDNNLMISDLALIKQ